MAEPCTTNFICLLFLFLVGVVADMDSVNPYIEFGLDREEICNPSSDKVGVLETLRKYKDSAIKINSSHVFDSWQVRYNKHCKFKIKATKGEGLFGVVQKMSLRRNGTDCLDYIRFVQENNPESEKYCGKLDNLDGQKRYSSNIGNGPYEVSIPDDQNEVEIMRTRGMFDIFSKYGKITTEIFISKQPLKPGESLNLVIVYTPYKNCNYAEPKSRYWSGPPYPSTCISSHFACDGYANCASAVCLDESNCTSVVNRVISDGIGTKVTISAVTTMILCLIIFVLCLWICRKHKKLCWSTDCAGPSGVVTGSTSGLPMERGEQNAPNQPYISSAPMLEVAVPASHNDKDLPPSYDSLFPSQTNTTSTA